MKVKWVENFRSPQLQTEYGHRDGHPVEAAFKHRTFIWSSQMMGLSRLLTIYNALLCMLSYGLSNSSI
jgi:hypothetical protein